MQTLGMLGHHHNNSFSSKTFSVRDLATENINGTDLDIHCRYGEDIMTYFLLRVILWHSGTHQGEQWIYMFYCALTIIDNILKLNEQNINSIPDRIILIFFVLWYDNKLRYLVRYSLIWKLLQFVRSDFTDHPAQTVAIVQMKHHVMFGMEPASMDAIENGQDPHATRLVSACHD